MASLLDSYDRSLDRHSGDQVNPSPLNISHSFEYLGGNEIREPEEGKINFLLLQDD